MNWLLLRGWARNKKHWLNFPRELQAIDGVKEVYCLDLPGMGTESQRLSPPSVPWIIEDLKSRFHRLNIEGPVSILGHSLGAMVALNWAGQFRQDFESVCLINPSFRSLSPFYQRLKPESLSSLYKIVRAKGGSLQEQEVLGLVCSKNSTDPDVVQAWTDINESDPTPRINAFFQLLAASLCKAPSQVKIPVMVLAGEQDKLVSCQCSKDVAKKYKARLVVHEQGGHDLVVDDIDWVVEQIRTFMKSKTTK